MEIHNLKPEKGSIKKEKRVGRGEGSGMGKTCGRGQKGQKSRSGKGPRLGFEGGQNPLQRRLPRLPGFKNIFKKEYAIVNVDKINTFKSGSIIDPEKLYEKKVVRKKGILIKILGKGEITKPFTVKANSFSKIAVDKIEKAGGKVEVI
ncbi:50S ribosomal protein L15 [Candidatus Oleimmundimicrobium sp.]|uniref:50S ribosomal protein L15 n=1 Tax=Candidatus Oleimmundimicrobium sp. TaxID=3060597 RepID=UPI002726EBF6|nr:50S ribosomal protein L15 [Candidatus Oleimmundimicrobium sp.]MDO8886044.1 50S ribosomal protein L15 [Candidatus Oleimmundimicrobium sp.]